MTIAVVASRLIVPNRPSAARKGDTLCILKGVPPILSFLWAKCGYSTPLNYTMLKTEYCNIYPLTAPAVRPLTSCFWKIVNSATIGKETTVLAAIKSGQRS